MGQGMVTGVFAAFLNPSHIYEVMAYLSTFAVTMIGLWIVFLVIRIYSESIKAMAGKADLLGAVVDALKTVQWILIYSTSGMFIFGMFYAMSESYTSIGSVDQVNRTLYELRAGLNTTTTEEEAVSWYTAVIEAVVDAGSLPLSAILYLLFHISSFFYLLINSAIDVLFAVTLTLIYGYGFIAIVSMQLPEKYQLIDGFIKNMIAIFLWLIVEAILMVFASTLVYMGGETVLSLYKGFGYGHTAMTIWYLGSILCMLFIVILRVIAPFIAYFLSNNQAIVAATAAPAALLATQMGSKITDTLSKSDDKKSGDSILGGMKPDLEGDRLRDKIAQNISDISHSTPREAVSTIGSGIANAARAIDQHLTGGPHDQNIASPSSGGMADTSPTSNASTPGAQDPSAASDINPPQAGSSDLGADRSNSTISDGTTDQSNGASSDGVAAPSSSDVTSTAGSEPSPQTNSGSQAHESSSDITDNKTDQ